MDLSIIIVSWNVKEILRENLRNIFSSIPESEYGFKCEVIVVDNNSADGSVDMIRAEFPQVRVIANGQNLGFAKANNQAILESSGRYVLLLNPDMKALPNTFKNMLDWMDAHPETGIAGCKLVKEDGDILPHVRRYPAIWDQLAIVLKLPHLFPGVLDKYLYRDFDYSKEAEVDSIRGSFFMIRRKVIDDIGGLDERYFIWFEEVDYCRQASLSGWKIMYTPAATCIDLVGKSFSQVKRGKTQEYFRDSMLKYFQKWHTPIEYWLIKTAWPIGIFFAWLADVFKMGRKIKT